MPDNSALNTAVSEDGISIIDLSVPSQGTFQTSLLHQLWMFFSAGATIQEQPQDEQVLAFLKHIACLGLTEHDKTVTPYNPLYSLHTVSGAFDSLQARALLTSTGTATLPRYLAEPFFLPSVVHQRALSALRGNPLPPRINQWNSAHSGLLPTSTGDGSSTRTEQIPESATTHYSYPGIVSSTYTNLRTLSSPFKDTPSFCHADCAAIVLRNVLDVQYYLSFGKATLPFCSMLGSLTLVERVPGGFSSISCSGLYPVQTGYDINSAPNKHPLISPFYTVMRVPTHPSIALLHTLSHTSSSVLMTGAFSFHRLTDEVFYDGVTDLLTCTPVDGTKFVFITDTLTEEAARNLNTATLPAGAAYSLPSSAPMTATNVMLAYEYRDGSLRHTKSFLSKADINFLKCLAGTCVNQRSAIDSAIEQIAASI